MVDNNTVMEAGRCAECGAKAVNGLSCYMLQHPSNYTAEGYQHMVQLFADAYDNDWDTAHILRRNRELVRQIEKITNPIPSKDRKRKLRLWPMTIEDIYLGGEENAIENIKEWRTQIRKELSGRE